MKLDWMREYRPTVEAMISFGNAYSQVVNIPGIMTDAAMINATEVQVLEYILENEERHENMSTIAKRLNISQSTFSKMTKQLVSKNLLEKYHSSSNSKNVIIKVSTHGREVYEKYSRDTFERFWKDIFAELDKLDDASIAVFNDILTLFAEQTMDAIRSFNSSETVEQELIRIE